MRDPTPTPAQIEAGCGCSIPRIEDCREFGFPHGCYHAAAAEVREPRKTELEMGDLAHTLFLETIERCAQWARRYVPNRKNDRNRNAPQAEG